MTRSLRVDGLAQHTRTNEIDTEKALEAELEYGVDDEGRSTEHDLEKGNPECVAIAMRLSIPSQFSFFQTQK